MIPLTIKQQPIVQQPEPPKLSIDMAEQIADRAARKAAEETMAKNAEVNRESMESYNRFQQEQQNSTQGDDDSGDAELFDKATANNITKTVRAYESLQRVFSPPPDPTRQAIDGAISNLLSDFVTSRLGGGGTGVVAKKSSMLMDVLNTAAAHGFGESLGANLPQVIQSLTSSIGPKKTQELVDNLNNKMNTAGVGENSGSNITSDTSNVEKQKDMVLALDVNNPEHIKQYASAMGLTQKAAKGMLQIHQDDIITERKGNIGNPGTTNTEVTQALTILIQEMTGMKNVISDLQNKIVTLESDKNVKAEANIDVDTDSKWDDESEAYRPSVDVTNRSVNLFQSPIKVDVDDIKGNADPFFHETPKNVVSIAKVSSVAKESVLEEVKDKDGSSSFRMSGEQSNVVNEKIKDEKFDDKKENVVAKETPKAEPLQKVEETPPKLEETQPKIEEKQIRRKILRRSDLVSIKQKSPADTQEHYDIDNNLVMENKT